MILQFKGFKNNWSYADADLITATVVKITKEKICGNDSVEELRLIQEISQKIDCEIRKETNGANLTYIFDKPIYECGCAKVVMLSDKNKDVTYVFDMDKEVYLLNDSGKTIRKL